MLTSKRMVPFSLHQLTDFGIDPKTFRYIVAKGVNVRAPALPVGASRPRRHAVPLAAYREVCPSFVRVDTPGSTAANMTAFEYRHRRRPMFPFEPDLRWAP